ncbi:ABC transporter permease [uncultured Abyssibacter sp.]|uniref:ABC transporter permease n=1 Tax=uncultured Abyssibacter sp. TaxID=2320202 RepID=UPI0032B18F9B
MMLRRILAITRARNLEFVRDRSALGWNILLPLLLVLGLAIVFSGDNQPLYKVGVLTQATAQLPDAESEPLMGLRFTQFVPELDPERAIRLVERHRLDLLVDFQARRYWINTTSPKGYSLERILAGLPGPPLERATVTGEQTRYVDWLVPGILGMNMMFSCLFGVGYVIVRYRKAGYLKRLSATPIRPAEFLIAQILSRLLVIMVVTCAVFVGTEWLIGFPVDGSHLSLFVIALIGAVAMIAMGVAVAARTTSEELANGLLNLVTWPMMMVSGVWFSIEGAPAVVVWLARCLPLTHLLEAARAVMLDGVGLIDVADHLLILLVIAAGCLAFGAWSFRWRDV